MPREAAEGGLAPADCEPEADCNEQAIDGGEWQAAEAGLPTRLRECVHGTTTP
jgi:hypothetical protein